MLSIDNIRNDLKEIRYYYSKRELFDTAKAVAPSTLLANVERYNHAVKDAPARLYDVYVSLYVRHRTQTQLAQERNCSAAYIKQLNRRLCEYLLTVLGRNSEYLS